MAAITSSIEIARPPEAVFAYVDDLSRHGEWQEQIEEVKVQTEGPTRVGTRSWERRRMGSRTFESTYEITAHDPPRSASFRGLDGPVRVIGKFSVEPAGEGASRVTLELDFKGHGLGMLLAPLARKQARKQVPLDQQRMKERLESGA